MKDYSYKTITIDHLTDDEVELIEQVQMFAAYLGLSYADSKTNRKTLYYIKRRLDDGWSLSDFQAVLLGAKQLVERGLLEVNEMRLGDYFTPGNIPRFIAAYMDYLSGEPELHEPDEAPEKPKEVVRRRFEDDFENEQELIKKIKGGDDV